MAKGNYKDVQAMVLTLLLIMFASQTSAFDTFEYVQCFGLCSFDCFLVQGYYRYACEVNCVRKCTFEDKDKDDTDKNKPKGLEYGCNFESYCPIGECIHNIFPGADQESNSQKESFKNYANCVTECSKKVVDECDLYQLIPSPEAAPPA